MGHTLTITPETLPWVHSHLRNPNKPVQPAPYTSPRLANRQLKFFFHVLREQIFADILKWQQATFQTAARKDSTWLSTFTVMLAFAMVLEECQRTMQIQADAKARKRESSADAAQQEAYNACERIDARFALLVGLFQHKYRDRKWTRNGSFGPQTPLLNDPAEHEFCDELRNLLIGKRKSAMLAFYQHYLLISHSRTTSSRTQGRAVLVSNPMLLHHTTRCKIPASFPGPSCLNIEPDMKLCSSGATCHVAQPPQTLMVYKTTHIRTPPLLLPRLSFRTDSFDTLCFFRFLHFCYYLLGSR